MSCWDSITPQLQTLSVRQFKLSYWHLVVTLFLVSVRQLLIVLNCLTRISNCRSEHYLGWFGKTISNNCLTGSYKLPRLTRQDNSIVLPKLIFSIDLYTIYTHSDFGFQVYSKNLLRFITSSLRACLVTLFRSCPNETLPFFSEISNLVCVSLSYSIGLTDSVRGLFNLLDLTSAICCWIKKPKALCLF